MTCAFSIAGCDCCEILSDAFDRDAGTHLGDNWSEVVGDWSIAAGSPTNRLSIGSPGAILLATPLNPAGEPYTVVSVDVSPATNHDRARLLLGYLDQDNYFYAEARFSLSGAEGYLRIYQRSAGVDTLLSDSATASIPAGNTYQFSFCANEYGSLLAHLSGGTVSRVAVANNTTITDTRYGLGTGAVVGTSLEFDNFTAKRVANGECERCRACDCCGPVPLEWEVEFDVASLGESSTYTSCDCIDLGGLLTLSYDPPGTQSSGLCRWSYQYSGCWDAWELVLEVANDVSCLGLKLSLHRLIGGTTGEWRLSGPLATCRSDHVLSRTSALDCPNSLPQTVTVRAL